MQAQKGEPLLESSPFVAASPPEQPLLKQAPLVLAIAQIRFPTIASIAKQDFIGPFQEHIRARYPILRAERGLGILLGPEGLSAKPETGVVWKFLTSDEDWQVSLAPEFVAVEAKRYTNRREFLTRLGEALQALDGLAAPPIVDRVGVRYVNQITKDIEPSALADITQSELLGLSPLLEGTPDAELVHDIHDTLVTLSGAKLRMRWGHLPASASLDPTASAPNVPYWLFDVDMFQEGRLEYERESLLRLMEGFSERIYALFWWALGQKLAAREKS